jgi:hypothetical protein
MEKDETNTGRAATNTIAVAPFQCRARDNQTRRHSVFVRKLGGDTVEPRPAVLIFSKAIPAFILATLLGECSSSPSMKSTDSICAIPAAIVDFPDPDTPITTTARRRSEAEEVGSIPKG